MCGKLKTEVQHRYSDGKIRSERSVDFCVVGRKTKWEKTKKKKIPHLHQLDILDRKAESMLLSPQELEHKHVLSAELSEMHREEELYWFQRSKATRLLQGDTNTRYFQLVANGRHSRTRIFQLEQEEGTIVGHENLKTYIQSTTKNFSGSRNRITFL